MIFYTLIRFREMEFLKASEDLQCIFFVSVCPPRAQSLSLCNINIDFFFFFCSYHFYCDSHGVFRWICLKNWNMYHCFVCMYKINHRHKYTYQQFNSFIRWFWGDSLFLQFIKTQTTRTRYTLFFDAHFHIIFDLHIAKWLLRFFSDCHIPNYVKFSIRSWIYTWHIQLWRFILNEWYMRIVISFTILLYVLFPMAISIHQNLSCHWNTFFLFSIRKIFTKIKNISVFL